MALSSASGKPFSPSNINLSPRRPKKPWGSPRPPAPVRGKLLIRESGDRGGGYREAHPGSGQKSVSKVSMFLVPARKSAEEKAGQENTSADVVAPPTESTAASMTAAGRELQVPPESGDKARPTNKDRARGEEDDDIPELLPCGSGSEVTSGDVWGMLDSYVHRRSEVARANRHLGAIEAMRRVRRGKGVRLVGYSYIAFLRGSPRTFLICRALCVSMPVSICLAEITQNGITLPSTPPPAHALRRVKPPAAPREKQHTCT